MWTASWLAEFKGYMSLPTWHRLPNIVIVMVAKKFRKESKIMSQTAIVTNASRAVPNGIRLSTKAEPGRLLEELREAYQSLAREEQQQIKSFMLTLSKSNGDLLRRKESTNRGGTNGKPAMLERCRRWPPSSRVGTDRNIR
jgi:hypothetical protein